MKIEEYLKQFGIKEQIDTISLNRALYRKADKTLLQKKPAYSGELIARQRGDTYIPSINFLQHIGKQARHKVHVDNKGEWMVICGRDLFKKSVTKHTNPQPDDKVVIINQHDECIGYGDYQEGRIAVKNLFDIGNLLRRERKRR